MESSFKDLAIGDFFTVPHFKDEDGSVLIYQKVQCNRADDEYNAVLLNKGILVNVCDFTMYKRVDVEFSIHHE